MGLSPEIRRGGIGGSDIAAILGVDPRRDQLSLWAEKTGRLERLPPTPRMKLGKLFERAIVDYYAVLTGRAVRFCDYTMRHAFREWMVFTPDALCIHEPRGVDAKLVAWDQRHLWGETADDIPEHIQVQAFWYMAAMDFPAWDIAAVLGRDEGRIYTIGRDLDIEREMLARAEEFWLRYIVGGEMPEPGSSPETTRFIKERFPRHRLDMRDATVDEAMLLDEYAELRDEYDAVEDRRARLENSIRLAIGEGEGLAWAGGRFTWRNARDGVKVEWEELASKLLDERPEDERKLLKEEFSSVKPGVRRIHFQRTKQEVMHG